MDMYGPNKLRLMRYEASVVVISLRHLLISRYLVGPRIMHNQADVLRNNVLNKDKIEDIIVQGTKICLIKNSIVTYLEPWFRHGYIKGQHY